MPIPFTLIQPDTITSPVVFASPHSGRDYPPDFLVMARVEAQVLRSSEDAFVDVLLQDAPRFGASVLTTDVPRAYVDFNRAADELDPALIDGAPRAGLNPRIASGLGVLARVVANGREIYRGKLPMAEAERRIRRYWTPYHGALARVLQQQVDRFGRVLLCDMHSMPHEALTGHVLRGGVRPDVVLGDRWGSSAGREVVAAVEEILRGAGFVVARNAPFAGAYIAQRYGQPSQGIHALQIEIDRALYLDEARVEPLPGFEDFRVVMRGVIEKLAALDLGQGGASLDLAAE
ncbi:N-formylglutamate amidohydrolase [Pararhodobacter zhoushanensis]|uniref:N-formylglutamate amidohydrolase n=1 Tax=Pararhodobacter zhoushanensis TaxID=2479545 RepID=A0ABT3GVQ9_9RHOB|nr:N-formylglutamate amidohydrolase [Pararhodobacter zhoushanensis]MCW1931618.1 N-formylglutamate amidohydrolase [Pararhodobacter zhoushanensis]